MLFNVGFITEGNCNNIRDEGGMEAFDKFFGLTMSNIQDIASGFSKRTNAQGRINSGMRRVKYTLGIMYRSQDESRCSCTASLIDIADAKEYKALLGIALYHAILRKVEYCQDDTISKASDPGKFMNDLTWPDWEVNFEKFLSTIPGFNGVPLSYVVRYQASPERTTYFQGGSISDTTDCVLLSRAHFQADTRKVYQLLKNYPVAETAELWISSIENCTNVRDKFDALCRHCSGEVNVRSRVVTAYPLQDTFYYKSERVLSFNTFLDSMQKMFNIFRNEGGAMANSTQVCELFRSVQRLQLYDTVKDLEVRYGLDGITHSEVDNYLTASVSKIPEHQFSLTFYGVQ